MKDTVKKSLNSAEVIALRKALRFSAAKRLRHHLPDMIILSGWPILCLHNPGSLLPQLVFALIAINYLVVRRLLQKGYGTSRNNPEETLLLLEDLTRHPELIALADALLIDQGDLKRFQYELLSKAITRQVLERDQDRLHAESAA